ncbi:ABC transporter permease subunit [Clostridium grantii]|uniref:ABC-2 type transport system permease protein n=1 Tax=Clostridium grantii DSM 8605 TaxID=1121316 RepID=A0A1M5S6Q6_9CLOT|nr:ABC transporter permease subunit [Clostridium grantii]SHH34171.1 ABC-2 type transport system permease protein [Clostridium grantii DSM 8605]
MNKTLFKSNIKFNWGIFAFISGMLLIYVTTSITMFDPDGAEAMMAMFEMLPEGMIKAFGFDGLGADLTSYLASYLYGFILLVFPMIYTIMVANKLVAKHVDSGSMAYLLATPNSRVEIILTQAIYLVTSTFVLIVFEISVLIIMAESLFPGLLRIKEFISLNLVTFLVIIVVGGISFLCSCIFNETKNSIAFGAGIPIIFFVLKMVSEISEKVEFLKYFSVYSIVNPEKIMNDGSYTTMVCLILVGVAVILYGSAIYIFNKKSLAI